MKKLSIIIPRYQETEQLMMLLLSSINTQIKIDFSTLEVIIVSDGTEKLNDDFCKLFNFDIVQLKLNKNSGPGVARQKGLNIARGDYIMFCDADDVLYSNDILSVIIMNFEKEQPDMLISAWLEETENDLLIHENENTWLFGKCFKKNFLHENDITFHPDLRIHEDSYFLGLCRALANKVIAIKNFTYIWKYNENSITRMNNKEYSFKSIPEYIHTFALASEIIEQKNPNDMPHRISQFIMYIYFNSHQPHWLLEENKNYLIAVEEAMSSYIKPFIKWYVNLSDEDKRWEYNEERKRSFSNFIEEETLDSWINRIRLI